MLTCMNLVFIGLGEFHLLRGLSESALNLEEVECERQYTQIPDVVVWIRMG